MGKPIIEVRNLSKEYRIATKAQPYHTLRDTMTRAVRIPWDIVHGRFVRKSHTPFLALNDISCTVEPGEVVGVVGRNGAGKTTLLKILSRITYPTAGEVVLRGRVASLLEVGTGFHPELTGRENIYFNGSILGMTKREINQKLNDIVSFAEVEKFIDTPVKHYSSGMQLRLAFSVAAHLEPEILIIDEVLAVGDVQFQKKCLGKMDDVAKEGRTIIFVSHNMEAVERLCSRTILLHEGKTIADGPTNEVINKYLHVGMAEQGERVWEIPAEAPGDDIVRLHAVRVRSSTGAICTTFDVRDTITIEIGYWVLKDGYGLTTSLGLLNERGYAILYSYDNCDSPWTDTKRPAGLYWSTCHIPGDFLTNGQISLNVGVVTHPHPVHTSVSDILRINVVDRFDPAGVRGNMPREWPAVAVRPRLHWRVVQEKK